MEELSEQQCRTLGNNNVDILHYMLEGFDGIKFTAYDNILLSNGLKT